MLFRKTVFARARDGGEPASCPTPCAAPSKSDLTLHPGTEF